MSVRIDIAYEGELQCSAIHGPSGDKLRTDAPVDNHGRGAHFSPTDLVATGAGTCMMTVMGIGAQRRSLDLTGSRVVVEKEMSTGLRRYIQRLVLQVTLPAALAPRDRDYLEQIARGCPVLASLGPDTKVDLTFDYR
ncbi:MAG: OsmC family protein [Deltaproteobacteria bacterium]|nr:OsmC family protein [Deltaproteobacteria bacterium]